MTLKPHLIATMLCLTAVGCDDGGEEPTTDMGVGTRAEIKHNLVSLNKILATNADIALAAYSDSVTTAQNLKIALDALATTPTDANLAAAKRAWLVAREPYGQTEVYRFRASPIDDTDYNVDNGEDGPEGDINAWPLGEALIDYVVLGGDFGAEQLDVTEHSTGVADPIMTNNIINSTNLPIDTALISNTATAADEHDVIAGYHVIEFLLWGQDLNTDGGVTDGTNREDAVKTYSYLESEGTLLTHGGQRPITDFDNSGGTCTSGAGHIVDDEICTRRLTYLSVAIDKLIADLTTVRDGWLDGAEYRTAFTNAPNLNTAKARLLEILTGMGTLSEGELAGERMQIALSSNSQEDEHSCFSDNTHRDIWLDAEGISNVYHGIYVGYDSTLDGFDNEMSNTVSGYGINDYLKEIGQTVLADEVTAALATTEANYTAIDAKARAGMPFDVLIMSPNSTDAEPVRNTILALNAQSAKIADIAVTLGLGDITSVVDPDASECDTTDPIALCP